MSTPGEVNKGVEKSRAERRFYFKEFLRFSSVSKELSIVVSISLITSSASLSEVIVGFWVYSEGIRIYPKGFGVWPAASATEWGTTDGTAEATRGSRVGDHGGHLGPGG